MMSPGGRVRRLTTVGGLALTLAAGPALAGQQPSGAPDAGSKDAAEPPDTSIVSERSLARIRQALEAEPRRQIDLDATFYLLVLETTPSFSDYLDAAPEGWSEITPIQPPSAGVGRGPSPASSAVAAGGFDLLGVFRSIGRARREREARRVRERIDRELEQFQRGAPATASDPADAAESGKPAAPR